LYIQKSFEEALETLKLEQDHILFIDGIDIRPDAISYEDYLACVRGLANAVWFVNNDFFANIKDSKGRLRTVLLVRPDIFNALGLQNQNSKIRDNSVILNWGTTYTEYRQSPLFKMTERLLSYQQDKEFPPGAVWDYYFPFNTPSVRSYQPRISSFINFLRYSLHRPRDILTMLSIMQENIIAEGRGPSATFRLSDFESPAFVRKYSDYMLGEVKDHLAFYYSSKPYEQFLKFFQFLDGRSRFTYDQYLRAFENYMAFLNRNAVEVPEFCNTPDNFLQFLYDLNVLCYIADAGDELFFGWCFRERSPSNIAPKVRTHVRYDVHYGLMKALDLGKSFDIDYDRS
jgi:hypothetical protein